jgi:hypothetical protein
VNAPDLVFCDAMDRAREMAAALIRLPSTADVQGTALLKTLLGEFDDGAWVEPNLSVDYVVSVELRVSPVVVRDLMSTVVSIRTKVPAGNRSECGSSVEWVIC